MCHKFWPTVHLSSTRRNQSTTKGQSVERQEGRTTYWSEEPRRSSTGRRQTAKFTLHWELLNIQVCFSRCSTASVRAERAHSERSDPRAVQAAQINNGCVHLESTLLSTPAMGLPRCLFHLKNRHLQSLDARARAHSKVGLNPMQGDLCACCWVVIFSYAVTFSNKVFCNLKFMVL